MSYVLFCAACGRVFEHRSVRKFCLDCQESGLISESNRRIAYMKAHPEISIPRLAIQFGVDSATIYKDIRHSRDPELQYRYGRRMAGRPWAAGEIDELRKLAAEEKTCKEASKIMCRSYYSIKQRAIREGIELRHG